MYNVGLDKVPIDLYKNDNLLDPHNFEQYTKGNQDLMSFGFAYDCNNKTSKVYSQIINSKLDSYSKKHNIDMLILQESCSILDYNPNKIKVNLYNSKPIKKYLINRILNKENDFVFEDSFIKKIISNN